jgi:exodeoxyribonuclease III
MVPTYHIDYVFLPSAWLANVTHFEVGRFADRCGNGLSDHVPIVLDLDL